MKIKIALFCIFALLALSACVPSAILTSSKMNKLELGMSKMEVTQILGNGYTIAEKRIENGVTIEVLSYKNAVAEEDEFYLFLFSDDKLEKWDRKFLPKYEFKDAQ